MEQHPWPGNVRELENLLHRAVALSDGDELVVEPAGPSAADRAFDTPPAPAQTPRSAPAPVADGIETLPHDLQAWLDQQERDILVRALQATHFNRTATAARLGISLRQIRYRIARLNITAPNDDNNADAES